MLRHGVCGPNTYKSKYITSTTKTYKSTDKIQVEHIVRVLFQLIYSLQLQITLKIEQHPKYKLISLFQGCERPLTKKKNNVKSAQNAKYGLKLKEKAENFEEQGYLLKQGILTTLQFRKSSF